MTKSIYVIALLATLMITCCVHNVYASSYAEIMEGAKGVNGGEGWENVYVPLDTGEDHSTTYTLRHSEDGDITGNTTICDSNSCDSFDN